LVLALGYQEKIASDPELLLSVLVADMIDHRWQRRCPSFVSQPETLVVALGHQYPKVGSISSNGRRV
jgi:hypothetical protein